MEKSGLYFLFVCLSGCSFLIGRYILCPGSYLENKDNLQICHNKKDTFLEKGTFNLFWVIGKKKTVFSLHFIERNSEKKNAHFA